MKIKLKQVAMTALLSSSLLMSAVPAAWADEVSSAPVAVASAVYDLNDSLHVTVEGVYNEKTSSGVRLGAVIRVSNTSGQTLRIPDHELRLKTSDGIVYTLRASESNAHGVQPDSEVELTYMKVVKRTTEVSVTDLSLVDVNYDVYPKQETPLFTVPVGSYVWSGSRSEFADPAAVKAWGEAFTVPTLESPLTYQPVDISRSNTNQGAAYTVKLLVENPSEQKETVPALEIDGKSSTNVYVGKMVETDSVSLEPGEKKYVHFVINAEMDTVLESLNVLTPETYEQGEDDAQTFSIGKLNIQLSGAKTQAEVSYQYGTPIAFEKWNDVINQDLAIAMTELHVTDNADQGSKLAFAKFKITNNGVSPIPVPGFQAQLSSPTGYDYNGERQKDAQQSVAPGTSAVVSYAFVLPVSEDSDTFTMNIQNVIQGASAQAGSTALKSTIASYKVAVQGDDDRHSISLFPYTMDIKDYFLSQITAPGQTVSVNYIYKLQLNLDLTRDLKTIVDNNFSKLKFELVDSSGSILGSKSFGFTGTDRLVNGRQTLTFSNLTMDQIQSGVSVNVYETISTATGDAERLITTLK
ncbi:hypothetical protein [Paenibacillus hexagrammi]|uniref:Uncharacterized protein n=1 Tax=Paenibacillus hexagrammi TaxID=2908839 RepID=A0ABY3SLR8_9BACL|nr:hypothetical protein [Paenibacillus sp. YPD9-1]UJF34131.1 hypothetical protein L0M14_02535 [Paenibacillus sp. YPD9-1]